MNIDSLTATNTFFTLLTPLVLLVVLGSTAWYHAKTERGSGTAVPLVIGAVAGVAGVTWLESVEAGSWGWGMLAVPFLFCKWMLIGYSIAWSARLFADTTASEHSNAPGYLVLALGAGYLIFSLVASPSMDASLVSRDTSASIKFWDGVLERQDASLDLAVYRRHLSRDFRSRINREIYDDRRNRETPRLTTAMLQLFDRLDIDVAAHPNIGDQLADILYQRYVSEQDEKVGAGLAANKGLAERLYHQLWESPGLHGTLVRNPGMPVDLLIMQLDSLMPAVDAGHVARSSVEKERLAIQRTLAVHRDTPADRLASLASHPNSKVRMAIAQNPSTPTQTLVSLLSSESPSIRRLAALNLASSAAAPVELLRRLSQYEDRSVRAAVAANPRTPADILAPSSRAR